MNDLNSAAASRTRSADRRDAQVGADAGKSGWRRAWGWGGWATEMGWRRHPRMWRDAVLGGAFFAALGIFAALATFDVHSVSALAWPAEPSRNLLGELGASVAAKLFLWFGLAAFAIPVLLATAAVAGFLFPPSVSPAPSSRVAPKDNGGSRGSYAAYKRPVTNLLHPPRVNTGPIRRPTEPIAALRADADAGANGDIHHAESGAAHPSAEFSPRLARRTAAAGAIVFATAAILGHGHPLTPGTPSAGGVVGIFLCDVLAIFGGPVGGRIVALALFVAAWVAAVGDVAWNALRLALHTPPFGHETTAEANAGNEANDNDNDNDGDGDGADAEGGDESDDEKAVGNNYGEAQSPLAKLAAMIGRYEPLRRLGAMAGNERLAAADADESIIFLPPDNGNGHWDGDGHGVVDGLIVEESAEPGVRGRSERSLSLSPRESWTDAVRIYRPSRRGRVVMGPTDTDTDNENEHMHEHVHEHVHEAEQVHEAEEWPEEVRITADDLAPMVVVASDSALTLPSVSDRSVRRIAFIDDDIHTQAPAPTSAFAAASDPAGHLSQSPRRGGTAKVVLPPALTAAATAAASASASASSSGLFFAAPAVVSPSDVVALNDGHYQLPRVEWLTASARRDTTRLTAQSRDMARQLLDVLAEFAVEAEVTAIHRGPTVTLFVLKMAPGIKLKRLTSLQDDLSMALRVESVRIVAPIPEMGGVGVEIPNVQTDTVLLRDLLESESALGSAGKMELPFFVGVDSVGGPVVANLADMPHLLIAGTTGSGKSVAANALVMSLIYTKHPDDVRLVMIDPKMVEFAAYRDIPHLLLPLVTDNREAAAVLSFLVDEMQRRYAVLERTLCKTIAEFNALTPAEREMREAAATAGGNDPRLTGDGESAPVRLPYIVAIVDELADLMMVAGKEVEGHICRLAQKSRAVGIHLVLATQRPSVDVITGLIKSNIPSRLAFRVLSSIDSKTILERPGAERLLGHGDALLMPAGRRDLIRCQGAFVSNADILAVVRQVKNQAPPNYLTLPASADLDSAVDGLARPTPKRKPRAA